MYVLLDGSVFAHSSFYFCKNQGLDIYGDLEYEFEEFFPYFVESFLNQVSNTIKHIDRTTRSRFSKLLIVWEGFDSRIPRRDVFLDYKKNRDKPSKKDAKEEQTVFCDNFITPLRKLLTEVNSRYNLAFDLLEGDDLIAYLSLFFSTQDEYSCIVSSDKDFFQLVGDPKICMIYYYRGNFINVDQNFVFDSFGVTSDKIVSFKALAGDPSDGYKGVKNIGKVKAIKYIDNLSHLSAEEYKQYEEGVLLATIPFEGLVKREDFCEDSLINYLSNIDLKQSPDWSVVDYLDFSKNIKDKLQMVV